MRHRDRSSVIAALALALAPWGARAQDGFPKAPDPKPALVSPMRASEAPEIAPTLPATPDKLALARQYAETAAQFDVKALSNYSVHDIESQIATPLKSLPKAQQSEVLLAFDDAMKAEVAAQEAREVDDLSTYIATRLTDDELKIAVEFYIHGVGYKLTHNPQALTPDERQQGGLYIYNHPAMSKFITVGVGWSKTVLARVPEYRTIFRADLKALVCQNLAKTSVKSPTCSEPGMNWTFQSSLGPPLANRN
jgi:hypothetical protein